MAAKKAPAKKASQKKKTAKSSAKAPLKAKAARRPAKHAAPASKNAAKNVSESVLSEPVMTRRMGVALRVDLGTPLDRQCSWSCLYCPWKPGKAEKAGKKGAHEKLPSRDFILDRLHSAMKSRRKIDSVVLTGYSEPTAHPEFAQVVDDLLALREETGGKWLIHCITNGAGLDKPETREACDKLDRVWIKLDCATEDLFKSTNRPLTELGSLRKQLELVRKLKSTWIQTTFWRNPADPNLQNWSAENLLGLLSLYEEIRPAGVHVTTLRPNSVCAQLRPINYENLEAFAIRVGELGIPVEVFP